MSEEDISTFTQQLITAIREAGQEQAASFLGQTANKINVNHDQAGG